LKEFQLLTKRYSESFEFSLGKGLAQMGLRRHPEALKFLDRAIRLCPNNADAWQEKGRLLQKMGQEGEAKSAFAEAQLRKAAGERSCPYWPNDLAQIQSLNFIN